LVDYNPKKGFHYHIDDQPIIKLKWVSLTEALKFFYDKVQEKLGDFLAENEVY